MKTLTGLLVAAFFSISLSLVAEDQKFEIDTVHSHLGFKVKHLSISNVAGSFNTFTGHWVIDSKTNALKELEGKVEIKSVDTNNAKRDEHLRKPDFFGEDKHPEMTFKLKKYLPSGKISGDLTIKGITKTAIWDAEVTKVIENPMNKGETLKQGISITGTINRKDFKIGDEYPDAVISDSIKISIELEGDAPNKK